LINNYNEIYNENKRLQDEITKKNTEITQITELLKGKVSVDDYTEYVEDAEDAGEI
jgi:hypothetical protein